MENIATVQSFQPPQIPPIRDWEGEVQEEINTLMMAVVGNEDDSEVASKLMALLSRISGLSERDKQDYFAWALRSLYRWTRASEQAQTAYVAQLLQA